MKIYTKSGDKGTTSLYSGERVSKDNPIFNVLGKLDRLNCDLGLIRSSCSTMDVTTAIKHIQDLLIKIGSCIGTFPSNWERYQKTRLFTLHLEVASLEKQIDEWTDQLPPLRTFLTPGDTESSSRVHSARVSCRDFERVLIHYCTELQEKNSTSYSFSFFYKTPLDDKTELFLLDLRDIGIYINRLSDYLFTLARFLDL